MDLNVKTIKLLEKTEEKDLDLGAKQKVLWSFKSKAWFIKGKTDKVKFIKTKKIFIYERSSLKNKKISYRLGKNCQVIYPKKD